MKNPNGYGSVFKLSGNRRKPFAARITVGWTDEGKQEYEYLGYFETRQKAMIALAEFNNHPFDLSRGKLTFKQIYERVKKEKWPNGPTKSERSNYLGYEAAYKQSEQIHDEAFVNLRKKHLQKVVDDCDRAHATKRKIRVLFRSMYRYSMEHDLISKDYSEFVDIGKNTAESSRKPFTAEGIQILWDHINRLDDIDTVLIMIYTGLRPGELVEIENEKIFLDERYFRGGFKTEAGTNRVIPVHKKIHHLIENRMNSNNKYLITNFEGKKLSYYVYYHNKFKKIMEQLNMSHRPHDCRHTFATIMDNAGANKLSIRRIMGHAGKDITDKVYTHKDIEQLLIAIDTLE